MGVCYCNAINVLVVAWILFVDFNQLQEPKEERKRESIKQMQIK